MNEQHMGRAQSAMDKYAEREAKEILALEFIYPDNYMLNYEGKGRGIEINDKYSMLLIPLNMPSSNAVEIFFGDNEEYFSGPVGIFVEPT